jgi:hypothetical protein
MKPQRRATSWSGTPVRLKSLKFPVPAIKLMILAERLNQRRWNYASLSWMLPTSSGPVLATMYACP